MAALVLQALPALSEPLLPLQRRQALLQALQNFFQVCASQGVLTPATLASHAEVLADYLCGSAPPKAGLLGSSLHGYQASTASEANTQESQKARPIRRALLTGCFDLMHPGHYNALRQAKAAFPEEEVILVAGVHSDEAIRKAKGAPTVLRHDERLELVKSCRWVDEAVGNLPYAVPVSLLDELHCDVAIHGDDLPRVPDGHGLFDEVMAAGRLRIVKRTEGTSTTMLIGRLLSMSKDHLLSRRIHDEVDAGPQLVSQESCQESQATAVQSSPVWTLLPTMSRMALFYSDRKRKQSGIMRVVYAPGEWDLFHIGHVRFLERARALGDFLIVGCYDDETINKKKGKNYPIQTLHERALNVLACRHVDDVLLGAPWTASKDLLTTLNVSSLVTGQNNQYAEPLCEGQKDPLAMGDPFTHARSAKLLQVIESECSLTMDTIADRILENVSTYLRRQSMKEVAEKAYNESKEYVAEQ